MLEEKALCFFEQAPTLCGHTCEADFYTDSPSGSLLFSKFLFFRKKMLGGVKRRTPNLQLNETKILP